MAILESIVKKLKPRKFSGEVIEVQMIPGEGRYNYHKQFVTLTHGNDEIGMPIKENYFEAVYDVTLRNQEGVTRKFRILGKPPEMYSQQTYHLRQARE